MLFPFFLNILESPNSLKILLLQSLPLLRYPTNLKIHKLQLEHNLIILNLINFPQFRNNKLIKSLKLKQLLTICILLIFPFKELE